MNCPNSKSWHIFELGGCSLSIFGIFKIYTLEVERLEPENDGLVQMIFRISKKGDL